MKTAKQIGDLRTSSSGASQLLFELSEPIAYKVFDDSNAQGLDRDEFGRVTRHAKHVLVSAVVAPFSGPETYIFPADESGKVVYWGELDGSYRGGMDHAQALTNAGYTIE